MKSQSSDVFTVLFIALSDSRETFTISRDCSAVDLPTLYRYMKAEADVSDDEMDTLLLWENGPSGPIVRDMWRAGNGDFEALQRTSTG